MSRTRSSPTSGCRWVAIGDPGDLRLHLFSQACAAAGADAPVVVDYRQLLAGDWGLPCGRGGVVVRFESPGRAPDLYDAFVRRGGGEPCDRDKGLIHQPGAWFRGFTSLLHESAVRWRDLDVAFTSHPEEISLAFDKTACNRRLAAAGLPVPRALGHVSSYDELRGQMAADRLTRVFVKLRYGSSASGIVALRTNGPRCQAFTTIETVGTGTGARLYNTRRVRRLDSEAHVRPLLDALCHNEVHVEEWIPKAGLEGGSCDLRVLVIGGRAMHRILRVSRSPMTNLHLLNRRVPAAKLERRMQPARWASLLDTCEQAARVFPRSLHLGLDVAVDSSLRRHYLLEVNAFGDLLKDVTHDGLSPYDAEVLAMLSAASAGGSSAEQSSVGGTSA